MCGFWTHVLNRGNKDVEVAKSGDNYYSIIRVGGEVVMAIVQPPTSFDGKTSVSGEVSVFDALGNLQVNRGKLTKYGEPFVLYNEDNRAGLKLVDMMAETKNLLPAALLAKPDIKIETEKLDQSEVITVKEHERVALPSSTMFQINEHGPVSVIRTPKLDESDKEVLNSLLQFMVISLIGAASQGYRSNIMLLDNADNRLKITARYNMDGYRDKNVSLRPDAGGAGKALKLDQLQRVDLVIQTHQQMGVDPLQVWENMMSIYALPIHDKEGASLGVLSIDSDKTLSQTRMYNDAGFDRAMRLAADSFGLILEKRA